MTFQNYLSGFALFIGVIVCMMSIAGVALHSVLLVSGALIGAVILTRAVRMHKTKTF